MSETPFAAWDITNISNTSKKFLLSRVGISIFFIILTSSLLKILMWRMRSWLFGRNKKNPWNSRSFKDLELLARFELATSSLPRMRSTDWAIAAYLSLCPWQLAHYTIRIEICQEEYKKSFVISGRNITRWFAVRKENNEMCVSVLRSKNINWNLQGCLGSGDRCRYGTRPCPPHLWGGW